MRTVLLFAKAPLLGQVKTRLSRLGLGDAATLRLYEAMLSDTLDMIGQLQRTQLIVSTTPESGVRLMQQRLVDHGLRAMVVPQAGSDFDSRFTDAVARCGIEGQRLIVALGADAPHLPSATVDEAFATMEQESAMVLGPSRDGGVHLIGLPTGTEPWTFNGVFGDGQELGLLTEMGEARGLIVVQSPPLLDIDEEQDLVTLLADQAVLERLPAMRAAVDEVGLRVQMSEDGPRLRWRPLGADDS